MLKLYFENYLFGGYSLRRVGDKCYLCNILDEKISALYLICNYETEITVNIEMGWS